MVSLKFGDVLGLAPHHRLSWEDAQSSYVLLYPEGIVKMNDTAAVIMKQCALHGSFERILAEVQALYPEEPVEPDVRAFLAEAISNGWVTVEQP